MAKLMTEQLGYDRYVAQGGDWGASVTARLGHSHSDHCIAIHTTSTTRPTPYMGPGSQPLTEAEQGLLRQREEWLAAEGGYSHIQGTKPQTLGYSLNDSPAGLCAWIVEKYRTWSDCGGDVESSYTKDELLTTVTIYWVTQSINSSTRLYYETLRKPWDFAQGERINVPVAVAVFPAEISRPPREWAERSYNVQQWTVMPSGGHFAALGGAGNCWWRICATSSAPCGRLPARTLKEGAGAANLSPSAALSVRSETRQPPYLRQAQDERLA